MLQSHKLESLTLRINNEETESKKIILPKTKKSPALLKQSKIISSPPRNRIIPEIVSPKCSPKSPNKMPPNKSVQSQKLQRQLSSSDPCRLKILPESQYEINSNSLTPKRKNQQRKIKNASSFDISWLPKFNIDQNDEIRHKTVDCISDESIDNFNQNFTQHFLETSSEDHASPLCEINIE